MILRVLLVSLATLLQCGLTTAANWAQLHGPNRQNNVVSAESPFNRRWGFAITSIQRTVPLNVQVPEFEKSKIYVMGGEDFHGNTTQQPFLASQASFGGNLGPYSHVSDPNQYPYDPRWFGVGGGKYRNDVWRSSGAAYKLIADPRQKMPRGESKPELVSSAFWEEMGSAVLPPAGVDYREWLCCMPQAHVPCLDATRCDDPEQLPTPENRRWSPRRGHRAVTVLADAGDRIVLMGGRARQLQPLPLRYRAGGLVDPQANSSQQQASTTVNGVVVTPTPKPVASLDQAVRAHERAVLMNDVWASDDGGGWYLINGGCYGGINQFDLAYPPGTQLQQCTSDADCTARRLGNAACRAGMCVCKHWSPRERFAAATADRAIYVAGGIAHVHRHRCGAYACDSETAIALNDVWRSLDGGATWVEIAAHAPWSPRADFALAFMASSGLLWAFGGRGAEPNDATINPLYGDAWYAELPGSASQWTLNASSNPWAPRCGHSVLVDASRFLLIGGLVEVPTDPLPAFPDPASQVDFAALHTISNVYRTRPFVQPAVYAGERQLGLQVQATEEVWIVETSGGALTGALANDSAATPTPQPSPSPAASLNIGGSVDVVQYPSRNRTIPLLPGTWYPDFDIANTLARGYFHGDDALSRAGFPPKLEALMLKNLGLYTARDLAGLTPAVIARFRDRGDLNFPGICFQVRKARALLARCDAAYRGYEGEFMRSIAYVDASTNTVAAPTPDDGCAGDAAAPGLSDVDVVCRQRWPAKAFTGAAIIDDAIYVVAGYEGRSNYAADFWYRDDRAPSTLITGAPATETSQYMFTFAADEPYCKFEYRAWDAATNRMIVDWTPAYSTFNAYGINGNQRRTRIEVRAIDPAGNRDGALEFGRNVYEWVYVPPFPLLAVVLGVLFFVLTLAVSLFLYARYKRLQAYRKYLEKRKNRRLKNQVSQTLREYEAGLMQQYVRRVDDTLAERAAAENDRRRAQELGEDYVPRFRFNNALPAGLRVLSIDGSGKGAERQE